MSQSKAIITGAFITALAVLVAAYIENNIKQPDVPNTPEITINNSNIQSSSIPETNDKKNSLPPIIESVNKENGLEGSNIELSAEETENKNNSKNEIQSSDFSDNPNELNQNNKLCLSTKKKADDLASKINDKLKKSNDKRKNIVYLYWKEKLIDISRYNCSSVENNKEIIAKSFQKAAEQLNI